MLVHRAWYIRVGFSLLAFLMSALSGLAQSSIIATYAGPPLPVKGAQGGTQAGFTQFCRSERRRGVLCPSLFRTECTGSQWMA